MLNFIGFLLCLPLITMLATLFLPTRFVNRNVNQVRRLLTHLAALNVIAAISALIISQTALGPISWTFGPKSLVSLSFYIDGVSSLMLSLVASVGWVICRFSIRYLDGEAQQGQYFKWTAFTLGAVSLVVLTGNLIVLVAALFLTSVGLHQLLVHYSDRPVARRAAAIKFFFSRLGDLALVVAAVALYRVFGTFELSEIFAEIAASSTATLAGHQELAVAGWSLVLCAIFKSAQFPFHTWLPDTMESPTPVSALMHAGIVNAGGYLLIRTAPIVLLTPAALWTVAGIGAFTTLMAALVMLSQTSVKRKLAWSTIAQMGFMMLQCGLGAFSAALLHIVAHSLYKAHAFLSSGSVLKEQTSMNTSTSVQHGPYAQPLAFVLSLAITIGLYLGIGSLLGISPESKPGAAVLGFVLCLGIASWMRRMFLSEKTFAVPAVSISAGLMLIYFASFSVVDQLVSETLASSSSLLTNTGFTLAVVFGFLSLLLVELFVGTRKQAKWLTSLYVHSSNGFYVDVLWRNAAKSLSA